MYVASRLIESGKLSAVILQSPVRLLDHVRWLARRVRRHGVIQVADELVFKIYYTLFLRRADARCRTVHLPTKIGDSSLRGNTQTPVYEVDSINSERGKAVLTSLKPDLVIMQARELIAKDILTIPRLGFVGCHPGIIPEYRGAYASFWAMSRGEPENVGISVYLADAGVDTGGLVSQRRSKPQFPIRHFKIESERLMRDGVNDLLDVLDMAERGALTAYRRPGVPSRFFSHLGLSDYLRAAWRLRRR